MAPFADPAAGMSTHAELSNQLDRAFSRGATAVLFVTTFSGRKDSSRVRAVSKLAEGSPRRQKSS